MAQHDNSYKLLFSHPRMVHDLLTGFVREAWVEQLDFTSLEKVSGSYVTDELRDREDDVIWRIRWGEDWVYVYLLLEFQSSVDRFMAVRIMSYVGLLYQDLIRQKALTPTGRLPPVLPVVLYNGEERWRAAPDIADLVEQVPGGLEHYRPALGYLLLDEGAIVNDPAWSEPARNVVAALFRLENNRDEQDMLHALGRLVDWLKAPEQTDLRRAFVVWIRRVLLPHRAPGMELPELNDLQELHEVHTMLAERIKKWPERWRQEGLEQGLEQGLERGLEQGREQGTRRMLARQIVKKYGAIPTWAQARLDQAGPEQLETWADAILEAETLEALLSEAPRH
ncbi:Rpn family recombination-promoting nuclease/putative transposase [Ectothiorhodospira mobilis]|uniref:Rpn family recombination-promoting nuclease/putative transposase n=1 Tax=Ectothiorhodospira mobilis TaxID=195064 RepID=UPI001EE854EA|nr:Rpn family recombination-promoting nuclease/putative transposase [Ectothiorhodospira mobilis]MCG5534704.1 Rpn family recombination-promoting nuclease/putative transposase [Ectothiorhodospira mobilis]